MDQPALSRRAILAGGAAALALPRIGRAAADSFKIGALLPLSGPQASDGQVQRDAFRLYMDQIGWQAGGRKIELIEADDEMKPPVGLQKTRRLVESDKVDLLIGPVSSAIAIAMVDYVKQSKVTWICSGAGIASITREKLIPNVFRTSCTTWQTNAPIGAWCPEHVGKRAVLMASDYAGGRDTLAEFKAAFVARGGQVVGEIYPPLGNKDFLPYLSDVKSGKPDFVFAFFSGVDTIAFLQQYDQSGLKASIPLACNGFTTQEQALDEVGDAALGITASLHYTAAYDGEVNRRFVKTFQEKFKKRANYAAEYGYVAAQVIAEALNKAGGKTDDREQWAEAILGVAFEAPRGPFRFDPKTHNVINRAYLTKVEKVDGVLQNVPIQIIENVKDPGAA